MLETLLHFMKSLDPALIYGVLFLIAYIENIFPPSPSDMVIVFGGSMIGLGIIGPIPALAWSTLGSTLGFMTMYGVGAWFDRSVVVKRHPKFLPEGSVKKVEEWFRKHGMWIIVVNRFLAGTRAVVSFCAGMSRMNFPQTTMLSMVSAGVWNAILLAGGYFLGHHWERIGFYLNAYSEIVSAIVIIVVVLAVTHYVLNQRRRKQRS